MGISLVLHGGVAALLVLGSRPEVASSSIVEFSVFEPPPPPPPPEPEPEPEPEPPPEKPKKKAKLATPVKKVREKPKPLEEPPPPPEEPPPPPPPPMGFALKMSSTVNTGGGISIRAAEGGGNAYADPTRTDLAPGISDRPPPPPAPPAPKTAPVLEITVRPDCPQVNVVYPPEARRLGLEGRVKVRALIGKDGRVEKARVLKKLGHGFDESAIAAVRKMRCKPGRAGKATIAVPITYTVTFVMEDW